MDRNYWLDLFSGETWELGKLAVQIRPRTQIKSKKFPKNFKIL
jgi:hypothetical protein